MQANARSNRAARRQNNSVQIAVLLVLGAETIFFGTLVVSYIASRMGGLASPFPQAEIFHFTIPVINTSVLLLSAIAGGVALRGIRRGRRGLLVTGLSIALLLGLVFVAGQVIEFSRSGMSPSDTAFGGVFFALLGFHALHVVSGVVVLGLLLLRARLGDFNPRRHTAIQAGMWFWYYVTAVWVVLFIVLYLV
jgi:cytochrome c oxidase subunit III